MSVLSTNVALVFTILLQDQVSAEINNDFRIMYDFKMAMPRISRLSDRIRILASNRYRRTLGIFYHSVVETKKYKSHMLRDI